MPGLLSSELIHFLPAIGREGLGRLLEDTDGVKRTVILATHNLRLGMRLSDRFVILVKGRIVYEGSPKGMELATLERLYSDYVAAT